MNRRDFVGLSGKIVAGSVASMAALQESLVSAAGASERKSATQRRPNFVFILADDWGWGDLGCYGHRRLRTPNLDRMARQGTLFTQFYVTSGVCSPTRTSFMTGLFPARLRIHGHLATAEQNQARGMPNFLDPKAPNVAALLKQVGYTTAHF
ncbi:sulfatase-like hydrolase/transferase, partial [Candidatus Sumerlaeota bacterium]|nr:sulfatase-like hydrolase/transferase [Candidatus Sumerlaeota bacterium]